MPPLTEAQIQRVLELNEEIASFGSVENADDLRRLRLLFAEKNRLLELEPPFFFIAKEDE